jgi:hypothetical protein
MVEGHPVLGVVAQQVATHYVNLWGRLGVKVDIASVLSVLADDGKVADLTFVGVGKKVRSVATASAPAQPGMKRGDRAFATRRANFLLAHPEMADKDEATIRSAIVSQPKQEKKASGRRGKGRRGVQDGRRNNGRRKATVTAETAAPPAQQAG